MEKFFQFLDDLKRVETIANQWRLVKTSENESAQRWTALAVNAINTIRLSYIKINN